MLAKRRGGAPPAEAEDDDGVQALVLDHLDDLVHVHARVARAALGAPPATPEGLLSGLSGLLGPCP